MGLSVANPCSSLSSVPSEVNGSHPLCPFLLFFFRLFRLFRGSQSPCLLFSLSPCLAFQVRGGGLVEEPRQFAVCGLYGLRGQAVEVWWAFQNGGHFVGFIGFVHEEQDVSGVVQDGIGQRNALARTASGRVP